MIFENKMNWVPYYCGQISKEAKTEYYFRIAEIVKNFLAAEYYDEYDYYGPAL